MVVGMTAVELSRMARHAAGQAFERLQLEWLADVLSLIAARLVIAAADRASNASR